jgi:hypothetical protein
MKKKWIPSFWPQQNNDKCHEGSQWHHIKIIKEEILKDNTKKFREKILDIVNQNVQNALKKFQDSKTKEHEKTKKQLKELRTSTNTKVK